MKKAIKIQALTLASLLSIGLLAGCSGPQGVQTGTDQSSSAGSSEPVKMQMGIWGIESVVNAHEIACEGIHEAVPEISEIELIVYPTSDDFFANLPTQIASNTAPDIVKSDYTYMYEYISKEYFVALDEEVLDLTPYTDGSVDMFRIDGKLYGMPINAQPFCLAINLDMWEEAGLEDIPNTMDDFYAAGEALAKIGKPALIFDNNIVYITSIIQGFGGGWNRGEGFNNATNAEALDSLLGLFEAGYAVTPTSLGVADSTAAFTQGMGAMVCAGPWYNSVMESGAPDTNFALIKLPCKSEDLRAYCPTIDGYFIVRGADVPLASKALNHVNRKEFQEAFYEGVGAMMSNEEVREHYFEKYQTAEELKDAMEYTKEMEFPAEATEFANIVVTEFGEAIFNPDSHLTGEDILGNVEEKFNK